MVAPSIYRPRRLIFSADTWEIYLPFSLSIKQLTFLTPIIHSHKHASEELVDFDSKLMVSQNDRILAGARPFSPAETKNQVFYLNQDVFFCLNNISQDRDSFGTTPCSDPFTTHDVFVVVGYGRGRGK